MSTATVGTIEQHAGDYKPNAWDQYTAEELRWWVYLLTKRAGHWDNPEKKAKDLYDAGNYAEMLKAKEAGTPT